MFREPARRGWWRPRTVRGSVGGGSALAGARGARGPGGAAVRRRSGASSSRVQVDDAQRGALLRLPGRGGGGRRAGSTSWWCRSRDPLAPVDPAAPPPGAPNDEVHHRLGSTARCCTSASGCTRLGRAARPAAALAATTQFSPRPRRAAGRSSWAERHADGGEAGVRLGLGGWEGWEHAAIHEKPRDGRSG